MDLLQTFVLTLIMMSMGALAKITIRDYKNWISLLLIGIDTFIFVILISDKGFEFAIVYTSARIIGTAGILFTANKKKEYIEGITIIPESEETFIVMVKKLQSLNYKYLVREIDTKDLFTKEVVVFSRTKEKSKSVLKVIPKGSLIMTSKTNNISIA